MFASKSYNLAYDLAGSDDPAWAHWTYEQKEWERFLQLDARRMRTSRARWLSFCMVLALGAGVLTVFMLGSFNVWLGLGAGSLVAAGGFFLLTAFGSAWFARSTDKWYEELKAQAREVVVTPIVIVIAGTALPLLRSGVSLRRAWAGYADPPRNTVPVLKFQLEELGNRRGPYEVWVPVPRGKESEGRELAERFQREIVRPARRTSR